MTRTKKQKEAGLGPHFELADTKKVSQLSGKMWFKSHIKFVLYFTNPLATIKAPFFILYYKMTSNILPNIPGRW